MKNALIKTLCIAAAVLVAAAGCNNAAKRKAAEEKALADSLAAVEAAAAEKAEAEKKEKEAEKTAATLPEEPFFDIVTTLGTIKVKLYSKTPKHRDNFEKLALSGYYDSLLFHRVINGFMIQGGDPTTRDTLVELYGTGGPDYTIPAEFVREYKHKKGALAAARKGDAANPMKESSGSQFYIVQDAEVCSQLDGAYTVFGETVEGLPVIDKIAAVKTDRYDRPINPVRIISIRPDAKRNAEAAAPPQQQ